jgi:hypothetical protein
MADNSSRRFKFISPGVFIDEIDNSQLPRTPTAVGPLVMGRAQRGPANIPVTINSFSEFVETFGNAVAGNTATDVWREGDFSAPTYAAFAAQAWLANNGPITFMRVLGDESSQATAAGKAGWKVPPIATGFAGNDDGGVYALVVFPEEVQNGVTGSVAAQFYCNSGRVLLSGSATVAGAGDGPAGLLNGSTLRTIDNIDNITLVVTGSTGNVDEKVIVSLNPASENFVRKAMNTNPTITNAAITTQATMTASQGGNFWVGETFERSLAQASTTSIGVLNSSLGSGISTGKFRGMLLPMTMPDGTTTYQQNDFEGAATRASTGWFISQDLSANSGSYYASNMQKLFRLEAITAGEEIQRQVKVSIDNIKAPEGNFQDYGSFSVLVRSIGDSDNSPQILERWDNLNLNPASPDFIAARIGDRYQKYDKANLRNVEYGQFANQSNYIRVVMDEDVAAGVSETRFVPFGVWGPLKYRDVSYLSGSGGWSNLSSTTPPASGTYANSVETMLNGGDFGRFGNAGYSGSAVQGGPDPVLLAVDADKQLGIRFPSVPLRQGSTWGSPRSLTKTFWGAWTGRNWNDTFYNESLPDMLRVRSFDVQSSGEDANPAATTHDIEGQTTTNATTESIVTSWVFSLDDISGSAADGYTYAAGQRRSGDSVTSGGNTYKTALTAKLARFTTLLAGGTNGYDITEREPFRNTAFSSATDEKASYELFSLRKAINIASDPDYVQMNAVTIPGIWVSEVTDYLLDTAENRGDTLALIDIQYGYTPRAETNQSPESANSGNTASQAATTLATRSINNSYGATYYPWVRIFDSNSGQSLWAPPTVAALGVLSTTDRLQAPWFAPAGFTRGGLSEGAAGIPVLDVSQRLTSEDRDTLYETNINPIAKFPAEGIVVFGQKTLQQTASALDRINVRRLMIYLKREISFIASRLLFAPNVQDTWDRFLGQATPVLESVKAEFGIEEFRLILDESTTTPDLIDRNIIYAKLLVKPTRAVEFFAIDFVVTNSGASFAD